MKKVEKFKNEINYIQDTNIRKDLRKMISLLPEYFFEIPASNSDQAPELSKGEGGLVRHTKATAKIAHELLEDNINGMMFKDKDKDLIIMAIILHDGLKNGLKDLHQTQFDHPLLMSKFIMDNRNKLSLDVDDIRKICSMIESHMGENTKDPITNKEILPKPRTAEQKFFYLCHSLASSPFLSIKFE